MYKDGEQFSRAFMQYIASSIVDAVDKGNSGIFIMSMFPDMVIDSVNKCRDSKGHYIDAVTYLVNRITKVPHYETRTNKYIAIYSAVKRRLKEYFQSTDYSDNTAIVVALCIPDSQGRDTTGRYDAFHCDIAFISTNKEN